MSVADVDRRMTVADVLAEVDLQRYLYDLDVDDPPFAGQTPPPGRAYASAGLVTPGKGRSPGAAAAGGATAAGTEDDLPLSAFARKP